MKPDARAKRTPERPIRWKYLRRLTARQALSVFFLRRGAKRREWPRKRGWTGARRRLDGFSRWPCVRFAIGFAEASAGQRMRWPVTLPGGLAGQRGRAAFCPLGADTLQDDTADTTSLPSRESPTASARCFPQNGHFVTRRRIPSRYIAVESAAVSGLSRRAGGLLENEAGRCGRCRPRRRPQQPAPRSQAIAQMNVGRVA